MIIKSIICFFMLFAVKPLIAAGQSNPNAHIHGNGHLTLVYDNRRLLIEMTTPAANMLEFEHQPNTAKQWQAVEKLSRVLHQLEQMIILEPDCDVKTIVVELPFKRQTSDSHDKTEHLHKPESIARAHRDHDQNHHPDHKDIHARYEWLCIKPTLPKLTFKYFNRYPRFETITAEWVVNGSQGITQLNKRQSSLEIGQ